MSELAYINEAITSTSITDLKENIVSRRTVVYKTLIDPAVARMEGEKNKHKLFKRFLFKLNNPDEIEFVSIEKHYEPFIIVSGSYLIDYYRKCSYSVRVNKEVTEVILLNNTFVPKQNSNLPVNERGIKLEGEERIVKNTKKFLFINRNDQELSLNDYPSAPSEENPQELIKSLNMPETAPDMDIEAIRKRIAQRPNDANRIVNELFEIDQRSVLYRPIFRVTYKCPKIGKEAYVEFDGVTSKIIHQNKNCFLATIKAIPPKLKRLFCYAVKWLKPTK